MKKYEGHTPKPWRVSDLVGGTGEFIETADGKIGICTLQPGVTCATEKFTPKEERLANAILIADAPILAEQNKKMLTFLKKDCVDCKGSSQATREQCALCENGKLITEIEEGG